MSHSYVFFVSGMTCVSCSNTIKSCLKNDPSLGFEDLEINFASSDPKKLTIYLKEEKVPGTPEYLNQWNQIKNSIELFFTCEPTPRPTEEPLQPKVKAPAKEEPQDFWTLAENILTSHWFRGAIGCLTGLALLILMLSTGGLPLAAMIPIAVFSTIITLALGYPFYRHAWNALIHSQTINMDTLFSISTLTILGVSIASFFVPWLSMMFEAGLLIFGFRHLGLGIENSIKEQVTPKNFQDKVHQTAHKLVNNKEQEEALGSIKAGDRIIIYPGEVIPVDGICENEAFLYNIIKTGQPSPRDFKAKERVLAGLCLTKDSPPLTILVSKPAASSYLARMDNNISVSLKEKAPLLLFTERVLTFFTPAILILSILSGILIGIFFTPTLAILCAVSVLTSSCPCILGLVVPMAVTTGMQKAVTYGVRFKNPTALQQAEQIDTVVFDLNGTLTTGDKKVTHYQLVDTNEWTTEQFFTLCAALESSSIHPVGKAIYTFCTKQGASIQPPARLKKKYPTGLLAEIEQEEYVIGNIPLMKSLGIETEHLIHQQNLVAGDSLVFVAKQKQIIGCFTVTDPLRADAKKTINHLKSMGKNIHICTGADEETAKCYAKELGIEMQNVYANSEAIEVRAKPDYIAQLKSKGLKVAMVGDAANDAPALAKSDFGIALLSQDSDEQTQQEASALIQNNTLSSIISAFEISKQTVSNIKRNLLLNLGFNLVMVLVAGGVFVALGFALNPAVGVAIMIAQACLLLLSIYHLKNQPLEPIEKDPSFSNDKALEEQSTLTRQLKPNPKLESTLQDPTTASKRSLFFNPEKHPTNTLPKGIDHSVNPFDFNV